MYSPRISDEHIPSLYRLAKVKRIPMTRLVDEIVTQYLSHNKEELERYDPALHEPPLRKNAA